VSTATVLPGSGKTDGGDVEATVWLRTLFPIDPQPASISPTVNISVVFICAVPLQEWLTAHRLVGDHPAIICAAGAIQ